jgi:hypothetical protein
MSEETQNIELESKPASPEAVALSQEALAKLRNRPFAERHPELGRMVKCQICNRRHRSVQKCEQRFKELWVEEDLETGEITVIYATVVQPKGIELPGQVSANHPTQNQIVGAAAFKKRRQHPHPNKRNLQFIELVRSFVPNEFTEKDLSKAQKKARQILIKKFGRHGFLPPVWQKQKEVRA